MDPIKEAFARAKADVESLRAEIRELAAQIAELRRSNQQTNGSIPTNTPPLPTYKLNELPKPTLEAPESLFLPISTGNEGVPTNQPTIQPTNQRTGNEGVNIKPNFGPTHNPRETHTQNTIDHLSRVSEILASLDSLKKEVRIKFKRLTDQEMLIFTRIYELDDAGIDVTYTLLAENLNLSEISIRDYIRKIIAKGIPVEKTKENNKRIVLSISDELKQIASLQTINQLREL